MTEGLSKLLQPIVRAILALLLVGTVCVLCVGWAIGWVNDPAQALTVVVGLASVALTFYFQKQGASEE